MAKVLPDFSQDKRLEAYREMLKEAIDEGYVEPANSLASFQQMRQELNISDPDHEAILTALWQTDPELFDPTKRRSRENKIGRAHV